MVNNLICTLLYNFFSDVKYYQKIQSGEYVAVTVVSEFQCTRLDLAPGGDACQKIN